MDELLLYYVINVKPSSTACVHETLQKNARQSNPQILRQHLSLRPYKIQVTQGLKINDRRQRRLFANWASKNLGKDPNFKRKIVLSDEAHLCMNAYINKEHCH